MHIYVVLHFYYLFLYSLFVVLWHEKCNVLYFSIYTLTLTLHSYSDSNTVLIKQLLSLNRL